MKVINLTQHDVNVVNEDNETITFKPSGKVARVSMSQEVHGKIGPFKVYKKDFDLIGFIAKVSENLGWAAEMSYFVSCLQRDSKGNFDGIGNCQEDLTDIIPFMEETSDNSIFVPIAVSDLDGEVILAHGKNIKEDE